MNKICYFQKSLKVKKWTKAINLTLRRVYCFLLSFTNRQVLHILYLFELFLEVSLRIPLLSICLLSFKYVASFLLKHHSWQLIFFTQDSGISFKLHVKVFANYDQNDYNDNITTALGFFQLKCWFIMWKI